MACNWEWLDRRSWVPYDAPTCAQLDAAVQQGLQVFTLSAGYFATQPGVYVCNLGTMTQTNTRTGYVRTMRCLAAPAAAAGPHTGLAGTALERADDVVKQAYTRMSGGDLRRAVAMFDRHCAEMMAISDRWSALEEAMVHGEPLDDAHKAALSKTTNRSKRLMMEFSNLVHSDVVKVAVSLSGGSVLDRWLVRLSPDSLPPDSLLRADVANLPRNWPGSIDHVRMEVLFPPMYPVEPPFFRVVYPRFCWHTGHVSWGGSVCLEVRAWCVIML